MTQKETINHPQHYGGSQNPYECIKVIEAWDLNFNLGNTVKYLSRAGKKDPAKKLEDLRKAAWYLQREIEKHSVESEKLIPLIPIISEDPKPRDYISVKEAAEIMGEDLHTVRRMADAGHLKSKRTRGGHRKFKRKDVEEFNDATN